MRSSALRRDISSSRPRASYACPGVSGQDEDVIALSPGLLRCDLDGLVVDVLRRRESQDSRPRGGRRRGRAPGERTPSRSRRPARSAWHGVSGEDKDVLDFTPSTGGWAMYFDGTDVGLTTSGEDIDGFAARCLGQRLPVDEEHVHRRERRRESAPTRTSSPSTRPTTGTRRRRAPRSRSSSTGASSGSPGTTCSRSNGRKALEPAFTHDWHAACPVLQDSRFAVRCDKGCAASFRRGEEEGA